MEIYKVILTSTLISGVLSVIVSALVSIKLKNLDYKNEYYKKILEKRLEAYNFIETQIAVLKSSVIDDDTKNYHMIFAFGKDEFYKFQKNLFAAMSYSMWINDNTVDYMEKLNEMFFKISREINEMNEDELIIVGKNYYQNISGIRKSLEGSVKDDLLNLHNLKRFKKESANRIKRKIDL